MESGGEKAVKAVVTETGVKDALASSVISQATTIGRELRRQQIGRVPMSEDQVKSMLETMIEKQAEEGGINPLLSLPGRCCEVLSVCSSI